MFRKSIHFAVALLTLGSLTTAFELKGESNPNSLTVNIDTTRPGITIPDNFLGLSFEAAALLPDQNGRRYFRPDNQPLLNLFHTLGIKSLRIGGNTSDRDAVRLPSEADLDSLFAFARLADVKVIYCLRLWHGLPAEAAKTAKYIAGKYGDLLDCFSIGQEPSSYHTGSVTPNSTNKTNHLVKYNTYPAYQSEWRKFSEAILQDVPDARFCGPSVINKTNWIQEFVADFGRTNHVNMLTAHLYPGGAGEKVPSPQIGCAKMLSEDFFGPCQKLLDFSLPLARANSLPFRLEEANNFYNGGAKNVSDTYAASLWGLEFLHWWASHGAAGINFHTGDRVAAGANLNVSRYTAFVSASNGVSARPLAYGIKMFSLAATGSYLPVETTESSTNLAIFATQTPTGQIQLTVINKSENPVSMSTVFNGDIRIKKIQTIQMMGPTDFTSTRTPVEVGNSSIRTSGDWLGEWSQLNPAVGSRLNLSVPPCSAQIYQVDYVMLHGKSPKIAKNSTD